jgi:hypothetical protein
MPHRSLPSANSLATAFSKAQKASLIGLLAACLFALGLTDGAFVDEYAYITQSYQPDLLLAGKRHDPSWLEGLAYDLVPLPKYLINFAYRAAGIARPQRRDAIAWYAKTSYRWGADGELLTARLPSIGMAALGCAAIFALGSMIQNELTGWVAALLLAVNPLYRLHAHRAMSEASCEAMLLVALALALCAWRLNRARGSQAGSLPLMIVAGCAAGLSTLAKFNGLLALVVMVAWCGLGLLLAQIETARKLTMIAGTGIAILAGATVFVALNPFMAAQPTGWLPPDLQETANLSVAGRFRLLVVHRVQVSRDQQKMFPHNALHTLDERARVLTLQGFGRFGPLGPTRTDSTRRYDLDQDWGALIWLPLVGVGFVRSIRLGRQQVEADRFPAGWALAIWAGLAVVVVAAYLPMAWDRYQLPIQAPVALLAALPLTDALAALRSQLKLRSPRP